MSAPHLVPAPATGTPTLPLFLYGTLKPGEVRWFALDGRTVGEPVEAHVPGHLYDTGWGYPAWVPADEGSVPGVVLALAPETAAAVWAEVCEIEGGVEGEYAPVETRTLDGTSVLAFPYHVAPGSPVPQGFIRIAAWHHGPVAMEV